MIAKMPKVIKPPVGEIYQTVESPKGELGMYLVSDGTTRPYRLRCRPPCFINLQALRQMSIGHLVADVVASSGASTSFWVKWTGERRRPWLSAICQKTERT